MDAGTRDKKNASIVICFCWNQRLGVARTHIVAGDAATEVGEAVFLDGDPRGATMDATWGRDKKLLRRWFFFSAIWRWLAPVASVDGKRRRRESTARQNGRGRNARCGGGRAAAMFFCFGRDDRGRKTTHHVGIERLDAAKSDARAATGRNWAGRLAPSIVQQIYILGHIK